MYVNKTCINCQNDVEENVFCPFCGLSQKCLNCDTPFESDEKFCGACGTERQGLSSDDQKQIEEPIQQANTQDNISSTEGEQKRKTSQTKISPMAKGIIAIIAVAILIFIFDPFNLSTENRVEKTANDYFKAMETRDRNLLENTYHPRSPDIEYFDTFGEFFDELFDYYLDDTDIELIDITDVNIFGDEAEVKAFVSFSMIDSSEEYRDEIILDLKKIGSDWFVYETY